jgi:hypothetical protein
MKRYITQLFIDTDLSLSNLKNEIFEKILYKNIKIERCQLKRMPKYDGENVFSFTASSTKSLPILKNLFNKIGNVSWFVITIDNDYKHSNHPSLKPYELVIKPKKY